MSSPPRLQAGIDRGALTASYSSPSSPTMEDLQAAIHARKLHVVYQPKVHCGSGDLAGFEALARWHHPRLGEVSPNQFIPLAERSGLIDTLTQKVIYQAVDTFSRLNSESLLVNSDMGGADHRGEMMLAVNLSPTSLVDHRFLDQIITRCGSLGLSPSQLVFEITESDALGYPIQNMRYLNRLREYGCGLAMDDFGIGFSSMLRLVQLPVTELKIDKYFVQRATRSGKARAIIESSVALGHRLGLTLTAEGVETAETYQLLRDIGCDYIQGYWVAPPLDAPDLLPWIHHRTNRSADMHSS